jgi:hypothetical protein
MQYLKQFLIVNGAGPELRLTDKAEAATLSFFISGLAPTSAR